MLEAPRITLDDLNDVASGADVAASSNGKPDGPRLIDLRDIDVRQVEWVDKPYLPRGELVVNIASGGTGKGLVSVYYAGKISRGELGGEPRMCVFAVAEDAFDTVFKPRLVAAGADLTYVRALRWYRRGLDDTFLIPDDVPRVERVIRELDAGLFVIDPLLSHLAGKTDSYKDHEVKRALAPLVALAQRTGCPILGNLHFKKDTSRGARNAAQGSSAFVDVPRVAWGMAKDPEDESLRVLEILKSNIGPEGSGRDWRLHFAPVPGLEDEAPLILPGDTSSRSVDALLRSASEGRSVSSEALRELVLRELGSGPKSRDHLNETAADELDASPNAVYERALAPLKKGNAIAASKDGFTGGWTWHLVA
jgi:hypothetical protein